MNTENDIGPDQLPSAPLNAAVSPLASHADILLARHVISPPQRTERLRDEPKECLCGRLSVHLRSRPPTLPWNGDETVNSPDHSIGLHALLFSNCDVYFSTWFSYNSLSFIHCRISLRIVFFVWTLWTLLFCSKKQFESKARGNRSCHCVRRSIILRTSRLFIYTELAVSKTKTNFLECTVSI